MMEVELGRRFIEGEQERIQQEKLEKKQAEQVAAGTISTARLCQCFVLSINGVEELLLH